jgi:hypothetical protein
MCDVAACSALLLWQQPSALLLLLLQVPCELLRLEAADSTAVSPIKQMMELLHAAAHIDMLSVFTLQGALHHNCIYMRPLLGSPGDTAVICQLSVQTLLLCYFSTK